MTMLPVLWYGPVLLLGSAILLLWLWSTVRPPLDRAALAWDSYVHTARWWQLLGMAALLAGCVWAVLDVLGTC